MKNATIKILGSNRLYDVNIDAHFKIMLPARKYNLLISCHQYEAKLVTIVVKENSILSMVIKLKKLNGTSSVISEEKVSSIATGIKGKLKNIKQSLTVLFVEMVSTNIHQNTKLHF